MEIDHRLHLPVIPVLVALAFPCVFGGCGPAFTTKLHPLDSAASCPETLEDALAPVNTDPYMATMSQLQCALQAIRGMKPPHAVESLEAAKICSVLAEAVPDNEAGRAMSRAFGWEGVAWAEHAMATGALIEPGSSYYYAVDLGLAVFDTIMSAMKNLGKLHRHLERAVKMDPDQDHGGPRRALGYMLIKAPGWPTGIGDPDRGLELLEEAVTFFPDYPINHLYRARGLWESSEDGDGAMEELELAVDTLNAGVWGVRRDRWIRDILKLAEEIEGPDAAAEFASRFKN